MLYLILMNVNNLTGCNSTAKQELNGINMFNNIKTKFPTD